MPTVAALYRYPVKGFTPERRDELVVQADGRVAGDRVLAFRFAAASEPEMRDGREYWPKDRGLALMEFPSLARLRLAFDHVGLRVRLSVGERVVADAGLDPAGRRELEEAITSFLAETPDGRRLAGDGVLPLRLVGDGVTSRFQDRPAGFVSLHGAASVEAVDATVPAPVDDRRFRSNIVIGGTTPWEELGWAGRVRIGEVWFEVQRPIGRCAAIMANPDTGERDARLLRILTTQFAQDEAILGVLLLPLEGGGTVRVGDAVTLDSTR
ncbi:MULTISPECIES: MOSC domain-containing protein [Microbacterium]|uniref:MOSC domain-containing protein n=1 Tax=Microbacterium wangchenii TaxID=2541726 RepID=A0ABX5STS3_9MICO|nr:MULTISPECIES: MOSC domain-containing protein [Microbacterium]MCK6067487.1 MOSC domain-containing protein [Microbacterium sp. EYE_512]QBR89580.1 MOSC domain-containing protein [Microbacterium wangchenii]TXK16822.1 MOSC domain-containing protein [Microbacterium wangchenii]